MARTVLPLIFIGILVLGTVAYAHHSIGATYDSREEITLHGKLVQFQYRNPHSFVHIEAEDEHGEIQRWSIEWGGAASLRGQGVSRDSLRAGDEVIISGNPARSGDTRLKMNTLHRLSDGFGWGTRPGEVVD